MRKLKLFMVACALMCIATTAWADVVPTPSTPTTGNSYYVYNPITKSFLLPLESQTPYVRPVGTPWLIEASEKDGFIKLRLKNDDNGYFWGKYWALIGGSYTTYPTETYFRLDKKDGSENDYQLYANAWDGTAGAYVYVNTSNSNRVACNSQEQGGLNEAYTLWQFISETDYATYMSEADINYSFSDLPSIDYTSKGSTPTGGKTYLLYNQTKKFMYNDAGSPKISSKKATFYTLETTADMFYIKSVDGFLEKTTANNWTTIVNGNQGDYAKWKTTLNDGKYTIYNYKRAKNTFYFAPNSNAEDVVCYADKTDLTGWYFIDITDKTLAVSLLNTLQKAKTNYYVPAEDGAAKTALLGALNSIYGEYVLASSFTSETYDAGEAAIQAAIAPLCSAKLEALKATIDDDYLNNATYDNIIGIERSNLIAAKSITAESETEEAYNAAISEVQSRINAFTAAKGNYDLLVTEKAKASALGMTTEAINTAAATTKTGLLALQDLKVAEYDYVTTEYQYGVTLGEWKSTATNTKAANFNNEHWSGTTHNYKNQYDNDGQGWNASSWSINFNQDVTLPAGKYVFKVAGRQASDEHITTSLVVKNGETELGTVSDFPRSNASRGINKSGRTSFNENNDQYANNGKGYGWEWRYVKFELAEDATVNIAINAVATALHCWVSFGDYTLQTDEEANIALIAYNVALNNARTVLNDATYANVQGTDRSNLQAAINADGTLDKSNKADIETATTNLNTAADAFISGLASWNAYVMVKGYADQINASALPYASEEKITAVTTAKNATVNTAADAVTQTAAINTANRAAYESNALAEGVATAVNVTNIIQNADGSATTGWSGSFSTASNEAYTEANGNATNTYFDKNGVKSFETSQTIHLLKGNYILSVTARAQADINSFKMQATNNAGETEEINLTAMGNTNGVFNRGWNDFTLPFVQEADGDATIKIIADNTTNDANFWMSWDRFRLVSLNAINEPVEVTSAGFATYVSDYNLNYSGVTGLKAYKATVAGNTITFSPVTTVPAGEGVLLKAAEGSYNIPVTTGVSWTDDYNAFIRGTGEAVPSEDGDNHNYILNKVNGVIGFYLANGQTVATNRAYLQTTTNAARLNISFDDDDQTTGIARVEETVANDAVYTLSGVRVEKPTKGLYIKNGKKVVIK